MAISRSLRSLRSLGLFSLLALALVASAATPSVVAAQNDANRIFHSPHSANVATAEMVPRGNLLIEITHRFFPAVSEGEQSLWGFDGPVFNRLGLSYGVAERVTVGILRTNLEDNLELNAKALFYQGGSESLAMKAGAMAGISWNTQVSELQGATDNESQFYAQLMFNAGFGDGFALGVVPTYLRNPRLRDFEADDAFVLGLNAQYYTSGPVSFLAEWIVSEARTDFEHDSGTFGIELETRGHRFKILLSNQVRTNPSQFLAGTPFEFTPDEWRLGFNITRRLAF